MSVYRYLTRKHHRYRTKAVWHRNSGRIEDARRAARVARQSLYRAVLWYMNGKVPTGIESDRGMPRRRIEAFHQLFPSARRAK